MIRLILGGARSGKSRYAEKIAKSIDKKVCYIATATEGDYEMAQRIAHHQATRPAHWELFEEPLQLSETLKKIEKRGGVILIDCVTLWLSNWLCMLQEHPEKLNLWEMEKKSLLEYLATSKSDILIVSNEVGSGIVPMGELSRQFADNAGWLNQSLSRVAEQVVLVVAGLPLMLKEPSRYCDDDLTC